MGSTPPHAHMHSTILTIHSTYCKHAVRIPGTSCCTVAFSLCKKWNSAYIGSIEKELLHITRNFAYPNQGRSHYVRFYCSTDIKMLVPGLVIWLDRFHLATKIYRDPPTFSNSYFTSSSVLSTPLLPPIMINSIVPFLFSSTVIVVLLARSIALVNDLTRSKYPMYLSLSFSGAM